MADLITLSSTTIANPSFAGTSSSPRLLGIPDIKKDRMGSILLLDSIQMSYNEVIGFLPKDSNKSRFRIGFVLPGGFSVAL
jgi:hypothetical protein